MCMPRVSSALLVNSTALRRKRPNTREFAHKRILLIQKMYAILYDGTQRKEKPQSVMIFNKNKQQSGVLIFVTATFLVCALHTLRGAKTYL